MKKDDVVYCNVCLDNSKESPDAVFLQAICHGEHIDVCTACMPTLIHGGVENAVKTNAQVEKEIGK